jgi:hypothetical protein
MIDAVEIDWIERAQLCLQQARTESSQEGISSLARDLTHHLEMMLCVITCMRLMSGELDDAQLVLTPRARALARPAGAH